MRSKIPVRKLLRWRLEKAKAEAPPAPSAARLLALARPWWEASPERFQLAIQRLRSIQVTGAKPVSKSLQSRARRPVPALIVRAKAELETSVRVLSMRLSNGRMQLRFQFETVPEPDEQTLEVTFVSELTLKPLFCAFAARSVGREYRLEN